MDGEAWSAASMGRPGLLHPWGFKELDITEWVNWTELIQSLSSYDYLVSPSIMSSSFIHIVACSRIPAFQRLEIIPLFVQTTVLYSLIDFCVTSTSWLLGIMLLWTWISNISSRSCFQFLWVCIRKCNCWVMSWLHILFVKAPQFCFP